MFLLDTVVISEIRKPRPHPTVAEWFDALSPANAHLSVLTIAEIERGIARQRITDDAFASTLERWLHVVIDDFGDRVLPVSLPIGRIWGRLAQRLGRFDADGGIAATALAHDLTVVTRNVRHFEGTGAKILNPFEG